MVEVKVCKPRFLSGATEQARRIATFDWATTSLGSVQSWSATTVALIDVMLSSSQPMFQAWGRDRAWLYNDAFVSIAASKHPGILGLPACEVWAEAWSDLKTLVDSVFDGQAVEKTGFKIAIDRNERVEDAFFDFSCTPVFGDDGEVVAMFGVCTETTSRVLSDRNLLATAEDERDRLFEMTRDLFGVATFDGLLKTINPAWSQQLGRSHEFLLSHPFADVIHPDDLPVTAETIAALKEGKPVHQFLVRLLKEDGTAIPFAWSAVPEGTPGSNIFYTVGRDISEDIAAEKELKLAQDALRQAQKMEAVGQLTGGIAHDFNNLLGGIIGSLELLKVRVSQGRFSEIDKYIDGAHTAANKAAALTHRLLAFSRRQTLDPQVTDVGLLVDSMDELIRRTVGAHIAMEISKPTELWFTLVDRNQLENGLLNLCINARDAMPGSGRLTIEVSNHTLDTKAATAFHLNAGQYISLSVIDTGTGMTSDVIERAVDPFFTTKPLGEGTGLGLSMIYGFVRQSSGQIHIASEVGIGSKVSIFLPRVEQRQAQSDETPKLPKQSVGGNETVLIIDDEDSIRMLVAEVLSDLGYRTLEASDGQSGLKLLNANPHIALLVTDVGLPGGMNGRQVADAARVAKPDLKVVFITGYAEAAVWGESRLQENMHVLTKPFTMDVLAQKVTELLSN